MKVQFSVVPPGGGENLAHFECEMPTLPNVGDYVIQREREKGLGGAVWNAFVVRHRLFWPEEKEENHPILVEVEPVRYRLQSEAHKAACEKYERQGKVVQKMEDSCY